MRVPITDFQLEFDDDSKPVALHGRYYVGDYKRIVSLAYEFTIPITEVKKLGIVNEEPVYDNWGMSTGKYKTVIVPDPLDKEQSNGC